MSKPIIAIDFDGVLNTYDGWRGEDELFLPREGAYLFLWKLSRNYEIVIFSTRSPVKIEEWLVEHDMIDFVSKVTKIKIPAQVYIDDRAIQFNGEFEDTINQIHLFSPYWKKGEKDEEISQKTVEGIIK